MEYIVLSHVRGFHFTATLISRVGSEVRFNRVPVGGTLNRVVIHWPESCHPAPTSAQGRPLFVHAVWWAWSCSASASAAKAAPACYSVYRRCSFFFFFHRAHEGIKLIIAVCVGMAPLSRQRDREGDLGCAPSWLPVTVKCFPVWEDGIHLSKQVCWLKWLPVWECSHLSVDQSSWSLSLCSCLCPDRLRSLPRRHARLFQHSCTILTWHAG